MIVRSARNGKGRGPPLRPRRLAHLLPVGQAEDWFCHMEFECERRDCSSGGISQLEPRDNSGSLKLRGGDADKISISWDRARAMC